VTNNEIIKSFKLKKELNPKFWVNGTLNPKVREKLLEIADEFIEFLEVPVIVDDIIFIGSLTNYNWSKYSDIDLHISCDFNQFPKNVRDLYEELFLVKKTIFNLNHNIKIFGYDVELYVEDSNKGNFSNGAYSVLKDEWILEPEKENQSVDKELLKSKISHWTSLIDTLTDNYNNEDLDEVLKYSDCIKDKLSKYRKTGLENEGEQSIENLVFKYLRRSGHIKKLKDLKNKIVDKKLSLVESLIKSDKNIKIL
jgi:hypothetical protein